MGKRVGIASGGEKLVEIQSTWERRRSAGGPDTTQALLLLQHSLGSKLLVSPTPGDSALLFSGLAEGSTSCS